jgi:pimeloyl-ACP methyl ester carboxylesterase
MTTAGHPPPRLFRCYVDTAWGQVHCRIAEPEERRFPPLLCLHMSPKSGWVYEPLLERLGRDRLVVAPDTPGFGMSDAPPEPPALDYYTDALAATAAHFDAESAWHVLGYHTGSLIAADMALRDPARVARVVMISAPLTTEAEVAEFHRLGVGAPRAWDEAGESLLSLWRLVLRWRIKGLALSLSARSLADTLISGDKGWWGHQAAFAFDLANALPRITQPLSIINPGDDLCEASRRARAIQPDAVFVEKPEWSHGFIHHCPDEAAGLIGAMLVGDVGQPPE